MRKQFDKNDSFRRKKMKEIFLPKILFYEKKSQKELTLCKIQSRWTAALIASSILGISSGLMGLIISGLSLLGFLANNKGVSNLGTWLIVVAFPLIMFAATSLDKVDEAEKAIRLDYCRKHGLKEEDC